MDQKYVFLSHFDDTYSSKVRAFVLRDHMRRRTQQRHARKGTSSIPVNKTGSQDHALWLGALAARSSSPVTDLHLGMNRADPFQTSAFVISRDEKFYIDHYVFGSLLEYCRQRSDSYFPPRDVHFRDILPDQLGLTALIFFGVSSLSHYYPNDSKLRYQAKCYQAQTLQRLRTRLQQESSQPSDNTIHAVIAILASVAQVHRETASEDDWAETTTHIQGLRSLLACRGGWNPRNYSISLQWDLYWHDIVFNGALSARQTAFSAHLQPEKLSKSNLIALESVSDSWNRKCAVEFVNAYRNFYDASLSRLRSLRNSSGNCPIQLFAPNTAPYRVLKQCTGFAFSSIVPIIYLNIMWWNQQHLTPENLARQYSILRNNLRRCDVDLGSGVEWLVCALTQDLSTGKWTQPEWAHLLTRMLSVECKLTETTRCHLANSLLEFISATSWQATMTWWRPAYAENVIISELTGTAQKE